MTIRHTSKYNLPKRTIIGVFDELTFNNVSSLVLFEHWNIWSIGDKLHAMAPGSLKDHDLFQKIIDGNYYE